MGVKLRVRVAGVPGPAHSIEVPETCTLAQLRGSLVSKVLRELWGADVVAQNVFVSLGTEDLGTHASESATLRACGVTRGDLIRVARRDEGGSGSAGDGVTATGTASTSTTTTSEIRRNVLDAAERRNQGAASVSQNPTPMDTTEPRAETTSTRTSTDAYSELPSPLKGILSRQTQLQVEHKSAKLTGCEILFLTAYAALQDCGLESCLESGCPHLLDFDWRADAKSTGAIRATVKLSIREPETKSKCEVKAQSIGDRIVIAATASQKGSGDKFKTHVLTLSCDEWLLTGDSNNSNALSTIRFKDIRALWSLVKDAFVSRVLADARMAEGLTPVLFGLTSLPDSLKVSVFSQLTNFTDLLAVGSTCQSLKWISSADVLWQVQFVKTFPEQQNRQTVGSESKNTDAYSDSKNYRQKFKLAFLKKKDDEASRKRALEMMEAHAHARARQMGPLYSNPGFNPGGYVAPPVPGYTPGITGGDYDLYPGGFSSGGMPGFPGSGGGGLGGGGGGFPGGYYPPTPNGGWPVMPGGMPGGVPTPTPGGGLGRGGGRGSRGFPHGPPLPGWDGRPRPPGGPNGGGFL
ncbi:F-box protein [bacterium]|nr:F-box protein [bacterium]|tara:strand:+ start:692 stop:2425 length:1734 start_codon:yes stop_codon:yes gene_type:complete